MAIGNDVDAASVKSAILTIVNADTRVQPEPAPCVYSDNLTADKTVLNIEYWAKTSDWSETQYEMIDRLKDGMASMGVALK